MTNARDEQLDKAALPALKAVEHLLNLARDSPNVAYVIGRGTRSLELLCAAQAAYQGRDAKEVQEERLATFSREKSAAARLEAIDRAAHAVCDAREGDRQAAIDRLRLALEYPED